MVSGEEAGIEKPKFQPALADEQRIIKCDGEGGQVVGKQQRCPDTEPIEAAAAPSQLSAVRRSMRET